VRGFALLLSLDVLDKIKGASIAPLGCHKHSSINALGEITPKYRLTHDQSFPRPSGLSVNNRVRKDLLPPIMYSVVLSRSTFAKYIWMRPKGVAPHPVKLVGKA